MGMEQAFCWGAQGGKKAKKAGEGEDGKARRRGSKARKGRGTGRSGRQAGKRCEAQCKATQRNPSHSAS
jgi:hypothetical protein